MEVTIGHLNFNDLSVNERKHSQNIWIMFFADFRHQDDPAPGTNESLWQSQTFVDCLIALVLTYYWCETGHHEEVGERGCQNIKCNAMNFWINLFLFFSNVPLPVLVGAAVTLIHPDICSTVTVTILDQVVSEIFRWLETLTRTVLDIQTSAKASVPQSLPSQIPFLPGGTRAAIELHLEHSTGVQN